MDNITQMFKGPDFNTLLNCVQPIITKAKPHDENFDKDIKWADILTKMKGALENLKMDLKKENSSRKEKETQEMDFYFDCLANFVQNFP